jgi:prepilin-type N-terminal cleavage/methylation domain-containing protein
MARCSCIGRPLLRPLRRVLRRLAGSSRRVSERDGYTLVELLTVVAILGVVLGGLTTVFVSGSNAQVNEQHRFNAQEEAGVALDKLRADAHYACQVSLNAVGAPLGSSVTLWFPDQSGTCLHSSPSADVEVTWCTSGSGIRWGLYRQAGSSCGASTGEQWADYLTSGAAFAVSPADSSALARLHVDLPVNTRPDAQQREGYQLSDDIALRNTTRQ